MLDQLFTENGLMGWKNREGKIIIPAQYADIETVGNYNGNYLIRITDEIQKGRKKLRFHGLFTEDGRELLEIGFEDIRRAYDDVVIVRARDYFGLYAAQNGWVLEMEFDRIDPFLNKVYTVEKGQKQGLYIAGLELIPPIYNIIVSDVNWLNEEEWETFAAGANGAFKINYQGVVTPLTSAEIETVLASDNRYRYNETELRYLVLAAGDNLPADMLYSKGYEALVSKNYDEAIRNYKLAAAKGNADSMNDLGYIYETAEGYVDVNAAFEWYTKGVAIGSPHCANGLANFYIDGIACTADVNKALELYELAAKALLLHAHYNLGVLYFEGVRVEKNNEKALKHFSYASLHGYECHNYVGVLLEQIEDYPNAYKAYKDGAKYKDGDCAFNLARLHEEAKDVSRTYIKRLLFIKTP